MAAKKKKKVKYTGEVGHIVQVTWIDSGAAYNRAHIERDECVLSTMVNLGEIVILNKEKMVLRTCYSATFEGPEHEHNFVIWRPSIQNTRRLR